MPSALDWIEQLALQAHPEGGFYRETYRCADRFPVDGSDKSFPAGRSRSTGIYFLLEQGDFSAFHRIRSDELWHHYDGDVLHIHVIDPAGTYSCLKLGCDIGAGALPQAMVPAGFWFASELADAGDFALVGCTVAPGFDFADFELADGVELSRIYAQHADLISRLTR